MAAHEVLAVKVAEYGVYAAVMDAALAAKRVDPAGFIVAVWNGQALQAALKDGAADLAVAA